MNQTEKNKPDTKKVNICVWEIEMASNLSGRPWHWEKDDRFLYSEV